VRRETEVRRLSRRKSRKGDAGADRARFLKRVEIRPLDLQTAGRRDLLTASALITLFKVQNSITHWFFGLHL
jgi:hypothetical protein